MAYLISKDYLRAIQPRELSQITSDDDNVRLRAESTVEALIRSYLIQRYDLTQEFKSLNTYNPGTVYKGADRVYLDAVAYSENSTYPVHALTLFNGFVYHCKTAITSGEVFTPGNWDKLGSRYDIFFASFPKDEFDPEKFYSKNDQVFYKDKTYTATRDSIRSTHEAELQAGFIENVNKSNPTPGDGTSASISMWGSGTAYSIAANTLVTDNTKWTAGDNRNQLLVGVAIDLVIYELCKRISPNNIPEARHNAWERAIDVLKSFARGNTTAELPLLIPKQGAVVRHGGDVRRINNY